MYITVAQFIVYSYFTINYHLIIPTPNPLRSAFLNINISIYVKRGFWFSRFVKWTLFRKLQVCMNTFLPCYNIKQQYHFFLNLYLLLFKNIPWSPGKWICQGWKSTELPLLLLGAVVTRIQWPGRFLHLCCLVQMKESNDFFRSSLQGLA